MEINDFLTTIARSHSKKIEYVTFECLPVRTYGYTCRGSKPDSYHISVDGKQLVCPYHRIFVALHETAHVVLKHLGPGSRLEKARREQEATQWAFVEMGLVDDGGSPTQPGRKCFNCIRELIDQ